MHLTSLKSNSSRVRAPDPQSAADCEIDEALWAAYRRSDKSAVTKQLLRRYITMATAAGTLCRIKREPGAFPVQYLGANVPRAWAPGACFTGYKRSSDWPRMLTRNLFMWIRNCRAGCPTSRSTTCALTRAPITLRFWKENKETRHEVLALEDLLVQRRSGPRNLPNERAQLTLNGRFQDHRERGLASGLV
jgi:hypothetical protein